MYILNAVALLTIVLLVFIIYYVVQTINIEPIVRTTSLPFSQLSGDASSSLLSGDDKELKWSVSAIPSGKGPKTGVALMSIDGISRPILIVATGRHETGQCYIQFPKGDKDFQDPINIVAGSFTNASASKNLVLFSGGSDGGQETPSVIYEVLSDGSFQQKWNDASTSRSIRTGVFVNDSFDFLLGGYDKTTSNSTYAVLYTFKTDYKQWTQDRQFYTTTPRNIIKPAFTVSIHAPTQETIILGNRIDYSDFENDPSKAIQSTFYVNGPQKQYGRGAGYTTRSQCNEHAEGRGCDRQGLFYPKCRDGYKPFGCCLCTSTDRPVQEIVTNLQTTGIYTGPIIPGDENDIICVGNGEVGLRGQCFLQRPDGTRLTLGNIMDGRSVGVFDFTGNGLDDIFICCVSDPHCLLRQTSPGQFTAQYIDNYNGQARGLVIGHLYNDNTVQVVITTLTDNGQNSVYSFERI